MKQILTNREIGDIAHEIVIGVHTLDYFARAIEQHILEKIGEAVGKFEQEYMGGPVIWCQVEYAKDGTPLYAIPFIKEDE